MSHVYPHTKTEITQTRRLKYKSFGVGIYSLSLSLSLKFKPGDHSQPRFFAGLFFDFPVVSGSFLI
jgi:hypothetical protein